MQLLEVKVGQTVAFEIGGAEYRGVVKEIKTVQDRTHYGIDSNYRERNKAGRRKPHCRLFLGRSAFVVLASVP